MPFTVPPAVRFVLGAWSLIYGVVSYRRHVHWHRATATVVDAVVLNIAEDYPVELKVEYTVDGQSYSTFLPPRTGRLAAKNYIGRQVAISYWPGNPGVPRESATIPGIWGVAAAGIVGIALIFSASL